MADAGFPGHVTTTTTRTQSTTVISPAIRFDPLYVKSVPGILKVAQCIIGFCGFISASAAIQSWTATASWYEFVSMTGLIVTLALLLMYLFHIIEKFNQIPWLQGEFVYCAVWTFFYFTAALLTAIYSGGDSGFCFAAFFGFANMLAYGADAFFKYRGWKAGEIAQGERSVIKMTSTVTSPAY